MNQMLTFKSSKTFFMGISVIVILVVAILLFKSCKKRSVGFEINGDKITYVQVITSRLQEYERKTLEGKPDVKTFEIINNSFAHDKTHIWFQENIIEKADLQSFQPFEDSPYSKDKNFVWYGNQQILDADLSTFSVFQNNLSRSYSKDKTHVYHGVKSIANADPKTFELTQNWFIAKDKNHVYYADSDTIEVLAFANPKSFQWLSDDYSKDDKHVFYKKNLVPGSDSKSFKIKDGMAQDEQSIFYKGEKLKGLHVNTFKKMGKNNSFIVGEDAVYYEFQKLNIEYAKDFRIIAEESIHVYSTDGKNIFYRSTTLPNADVETFRILKQCVLSRDKNQVYKYENVVENIDIATFRYEQGQMYDKYGQIDIWKRKQQTNINSKLDENFDQILDFLKKEMTKSNTDFYKIDGYEVSLNDQTILLVKNGSLLSKINKETGVIALPMKASDNERSEKEANQIAKKLIELAK